MHPLGVCNVCVHFAAQPAMRGRYLNPLTSQTDCGRMAMTIGGYHMLSLSRVVKSCCEVLMSLPHWVIQQILFLPTVLLVMEPAHAQRHHASRLWELRNHACKAGPPIVFSVRISHIAWAAWSETAYHRSGLSGMEQLEGKSGARSCGSSRPTVVY